MASMAHKGGGLLPAKLAVCCADKACVCGCMCERVCVSVFFKATYHVDRHENMGIRLLTST